MTGPGWARLPFVEPGSEYELAPGELPFDELLLGAHEQRFTGVVLIGEAPEADRLFFRGGSIVGLLPRPSEDRALVLELLGQLDPLSRELLGATLEPASVADSVELAAQLLDLGLLPAEELDRAVEAHARRRAFALQELDGAPVRLREGLARLAHFRPVLIDVRPLLAYGMVARASEERRASAMAEAAGKRARLLAPYDEARNSYGLPPPILAALRALGGDGGVGFDAAPRLAGLSTRETGGLLLFLGRMGLLRLEAGDEPSA
jgi:hypothetical protein